ncbi:MAG: ATP-binding protein [Pseudomonadota bacterium]|nr:ATP-binding protein [Pseudomonadota bacterium]
MPLQIVKTRRDYNAWVANEMLEDYALRYAPRSFRKWSEFRVANTALGSISFLALEAIGGTLTLAYGFTNAFWAILAVSIIIFLTGLPISYYAARYNIDVDLLTRGAGFGYIGSTITSLIYASFTFIFFALEAAIMSLALSLYFDIPIALSYVISALVVIPLVLFGITWISRFQLITQPIWLILLFLPYFAVMHQNPGLLSDLLTFRGQSENGTEFDPLLFGAASAVAFALIAQIGEQADFLRFLPDLTAKNRYRWWSAMLLAGPGWIVLGFAKLLGGAFLAFVAIQHQVMPEKAVEPTQMYLVVFQYVFPDPADALLIATIFVLISQLKINVTNAYAGSLAWSNFFSRLTHNHPGRVVWLVLNVLIALLLMMLGVFETLENVLGLYANVAIAWVGALVADLVINKPLGLSPARIEFRRAYLHDINPVGVGAMGIASILSLCAYLGFFGTVAAAFAPYIALTAAFVSAPAIAWITGGRYYIAERTEPDRPYDQAAQACTVCGKHYEHEDTAFCPAYRGPICSLCCTLDARCEDACKQTPRFSELLGRLLPRATRGYLSPKTSRNFVEYMLVLGSISALMAITFLFIYLQEEINLGVMGTFQTQALREGFIKLYCTLVVATAMGTWWIVLSNESRRTAQQESNAQTHRLLREIEEHQKTDIKLQQAKEQADAANFAKSRFLGSMSHELRNPLNSLLGYAQLLHRADDIPLHRRPALGIMKDSGEHLLALINDILDIARIEARKLELSRDTIDFPSFVAKLTDMFRIEAANSGLHFQVDIKNAIPQWVRGDERRTRQILINLLSNAIKFTDQGEVIFRVSYANEIARFDVIDTGTGIDPAELNRIFEPFHRVTGEFQRPRIASSTDAGLGLTITKTLVDLMGGELTVTSTPHKGSTFRVRLFLPELSAERAHPNEQTIIGYVGPRRKILLVDDQPEQRKMLEILLAPLGFEIEHATGGYACLAAAKLWQPDLILLDLTMPDLSGREAARMLREAQGYTGKIVVVSANAFESEPAQNQLAGYDDYLIKPIHLPHLLDTLERHLSIRWRYHRPDQTLEPRAKRNEKRHAP